MTAAQGVMQFHHGGKSYRLAFKHETFQRPPKDKPEERQAFEFPKGTIGHQQIKGRTTCFIRVSVEGSDPKDSALLGTGVAECALSDTYHKEEGRQLALKRAIESAWPTEKQMWELAHHAYSTRNRGKKAKKAEPKAPEAA